MNQPAPDFSWVKEMKPAFVELREGMSRTTAVTALRDQGSEPFKPVRFYSTQRARYVGEVGRRENDLIFHFFALPNLAFPISDQSQKSFDDVMGDAFIEVFRYEDRVEAAYSDELKSWAVKVRGYGSNLAAPELCDRLFEALDRRLTI